MPTCLLRREQADHKDAVNPSLGLEPRHPWRGRFTLLPILTVSDLGLSSYVRYIENLDSGTLPQFEFIAETLAKRFSLFAIFIIIQQINQHLTGFFAHLFVVNAH